jgi:hypothetical protein
LTDLPFEVDRLRRGERDERAKGNGPNASASTWILSVDLVKQVAVVGTKIIAN